MHGGMVATWCGLHKRSASRTEHEWLCLQWLQYFTSILGISCLVITCWKSPTIINSPVWMCLKKWRYRIQHNMLWYMMAGCFTRGNYNTLIQILMTYDESLDGHDVPHFSIKPICGSLCHVQLRHVCWQTLNNLFAFWTISRPDLHRSSRPWVYVDGGCGMKHLELQWNWNSLILFRREKTRVTFSDFSLYLPRRPFSNLIWAMRSTLHCHEVVHHVSACLSMSQLGLVKQLRVRVAETASRSKHPWMRREARAHSECLMIRRYTWDISV